MEPGQSRVYHTEILKLPKYFPFIFYSQEAMVPGLGPSQPAGGSLGPWGSELCPSSNGDQGPRQSLHFFHHFRPREVEKIGQTVLTFLSKATFAWSFNTFQMCLFLKEPFE